jgi:hypothetical protein
MAAVRTPSRIPARSKYSLRRSHIVDARVILSAASCWADASLKTAKFTGSLHEIPGSNAYTLAQRAGGFSALPLYRFLRLLHA